MLNYEDFLNIFHFQTQYILYGQSHFETKNYNIIYIKSYNMYQIHILMLFKYMQLLSMTFAVFFCYKNYCRGKVIYPN